MTGSVGPSWLDSPSHHRWLSAEEDRLVRFHTTHALEDNVGFSPLDTTGQPDRGAPRELWLTCRMIHSFSLEHLLGRPGAAAIATHGLDAIDSWFHDSVHGGWFASITPDGDVKDPAKSAYGHAFVILAGASAAQAGLAGGAELLEKALRIVDKHLWVSAERAVVDECTRDWRVQEPEYRGQNANMHLAEAYMAATEATGDYAYAQRAAMIADRIVNGSGRAMQWRVPEHFDAQWKVVPDYNHDKPGDPFRPYGSLVGHWFEWSRLILQLDHLKPGVILDAASIASSLFDAGTADGWDANTGGVRYSVDFDGEPINRDRMHWVHAEGIGAAVALARATGESRFEDWYRRFWDYVATRHIDLVGGSWWHQLDETGNPKTDTWPGKPDLYHALQATLYARSGSGGGLVDMARKGHMS